MVPRNKLILIILAIFLISFASATCEEGQIDINNANIIELDELSGIGLVKGQAIIDTRPYNSIEELINVKGIGEITLQKIKDQGLACIETEESEDPDQPVEDLENKIDLIDQPSEETSSQKISDPLPKSISTIKLDSKDINTDQADEEITKSNYAMYGLLAFSILIIVLFLIKQTKYKNEFR